MTIGTRIIAAFRALTGNERPSAEARGRDRKDDAERDAEVRNSEELLRQAVRVAQFGIYDHDQRTDTVYWSPRQREIYGRGADEPITMRAFLDQLHPEDRAIIEASVRRAHDPASDGVFEVDHRIIRPNGEVRWVSTRGQTTFEGEGAARRPVRSVGACVDLTERRAAEEQRARLQAQLAHAQKLEAVGRLAGGVAHDFNNMLHVIMGFVELLKLRLPAGSTLAGHVAEIERAAHRSRDITRQLLALSRRQVISPAPSNLDALVAGARLALTRLLGEDVELRVVTGEGLWMVKVDPVQVDQILINLAANAREAMPTGGKLTIETANVRLDEAYCLQHVGRKPGEYVLMSVSDDGAGMDAETQSHVFEPFFTTREAGKGTGLGLATVHAIVQQNDGFIDLHSEPGVGTTFGIYLPRIVGGDAEAAPAPEAVDHGRSGTVLVVEDDGSVRRLTAALVESIGYTALTAGGGAEALELCGRLDRPIDVVLTDVVMPGMSGPELRDRLASSKPGIKVLFASAYAGNVIARHGVLEEGVHFIAKPFGVSDLARKLREVLAAK